MSIIFKKIGISFCVALVGLSPINLLAQENLNTNKLLIRDSLDFKQNEVGINTPTDEFSPIPYKGGFLFISNKKSSTNLLGSNKVYWLPNMQNGKKSTDSIPKKFKVNDDFTAPTSNDNNILTHYARQREMANLNVIEKEFVNFNPDKPFAINEIKNEIIYSKLSTRKINGAYRWELWQADLIEGRLKHEKRINIENAAADYLYPHISDSGDTLYFASNRTGGKGGYDIYTLTKQNGHWNQKPLAFDDVNTEFNEIYPSTNSISKSSILYTSDRIGGMGGYDIYQYNTNSKLNRNMGYPINTNNNELGLSIINDSYYLTTQKDSTIDIKALVYKPILIPVNGTLAYQNDTSLVPFQKLYVYDKDEQKLIDSLKTNDQAQYHFDAKPNRNYSLSTKNEEGQMETFDLVIGDQVLPNKNVSNKLIGKSPKQIKTAIQAELVLQESKRLDSIASLNFDNKFIVKFGFDKSILVKNEQLVLDALMNKLIHLPNAYIIIGAFTDCIGTYNYNYKLSVKRAEYVVNYLANKGLDMNRIVSNGYSKKYTLTPCETNFSKSKQQSSRRAEIVLSDQKSTEWATLEKERGATFYSIYNSSNQILTNTSLVKKKDVFVKEAPTAIVKKGSINKSISILKKEDNSLDTKVPAISKTENTTSIKQPSAKSINSINKIIASASNYNDEIAKEEIIKALDSLATLKREQERIVEYLTKRINKKPIEILVSSDSVSIEIFDNAIHDKDSVSIIYNNRIIVDKQELKVNKPIKFKLKVDANKFKNELIMVAENLGAEPPNTAVMFVTEKSGRRQQVMLSTDMTHNEVIYFIRIGKQ